jgi:hypothetical protein
LDLRHDYQHADCHPLLLVHLTALGLDLSFPIFLSNKKRQPFGLPFYLSKDELDISHQHRYLRLLFHA